MQHKSREKFQIFKTLSHMHTPTVDPIKNRSKKKTIGLFIHFNFIGFNEKKKTKIINCYISYNDGEIGTITWEKFNFIFLYQKKEKNSLKHKTITKTIIFFSLLMKNSLFVSYPMWIWK